MIVLQTITVADKIHKFLWTDPHVIKKYILPLAHCSIYHSRQFCSVFHSHSRNCDLLTYAHNKVCCEWRHVRPIFFLYQDREESVDLHIEKLTLQITSHFCLRSDMVQLGRIE